MTIPVQTTSILHTGNGVTTSFSVPFKFNQNSDVRVTKITIATGAQTVLTYGQYTLTGAGVQAGGTLTYSPAMTSAYKLLVERNMAYDQQLDLVREGSLNVESIETEFDNVVMMIQQLDGQADSAVTLASGYADAAAASAVSASSAAATAYASAASAAAAAEAAATSAGFRDFSNYATLIADTALTYSGSGINTVTAGQIIRVRDINASYTVLASGASTYHLITAGSVKLNVVPGVKGYNVKAFGAKGDGTTNDTSALTTTILKSIADGIPTYFPASTYMCNLSFTHPTAYGGLFWNGDAGTTTLKAYSNTSDVLNIASTYGMGQAVISGLIFDGNSGTTNHAFYVDSLNYSSFINCRFQRAWIGFRSTSFGCTFYNCDFGSSCSYGYVGIGNSGAYAGWHLFTDGCAFKGSKVCYLVDNLNTPNGDGAGNIHDRSDWEANATGLCVFMRSQGAARTEVWRNCWFEANATSGTINISDLPSPTGTLTTLTIPPSGVIIHSGTTTSNQYKTSRLVVEGGFGGADTLNDVEIVADRFEGAVTRSGTMTQANVFASGRQFAVFGPTAATGVLEAVVDRIDYVYGLANSGSAVGQVWGALGVHKSRLDYNVNMPNRFRAAGIDSAGITGGLTFSGAGTATVVQGQGGAMGRSYQITLNPGEEVDLLGSVGAAGGLANALSGYLGPVAFSFCISHAGSTSLPLTLRKVSDNGTGITRSDSGYLDVRGWWKTYNFMSTVAAYRPAIKNDGGAAVTFLLTDLQALDGGGAAGSTAGNTHLMRQRILEFLGTDRLAAYNLLNLQMFPNKVQPYILAQSNAAVSAGAVTSEAVLATITVPAGAVGANGYVRVETEWNTPAGTGTKNLIVRAGGAAGTQYLNIQNSTAQLGAIRTVVIRNNNSVTAQKSASPSNVAVGEGQFTAAGVTSTVTTSAAWDIVIAGQKSVSGDTLTLTGYTVIVNYAA